MIISYVAFILNKLCTRIFETNAQNRLIYYIIYSCKSNTKDSIQMKYAVDI